MTQNDNTIESSDEIEPEPLGPGILLSQAREKCGLSLQEVANKLNFRLALVKEIEENKFNTALPATFNRGYLKNYARLVNVPVQEVLDSFEALSSAKTEGVDMQRSAMQSFSKQIEKQAENNRLMWVSYLILAILIGSTLMWWLQDGELSIIDTNSHKNEETLTMAESEPTQSELLGATGTPEDFIDTETLPEKADEQVLDETEMALEEQDHVDTLTEQAVFDEMPLNEVDNTDAAELISSPVDVSFNFIGDCWVNIYDATGERIAWGIKKAGYEMNISGKAPFSITLGKPELVTIVYDGVAVDMSQFNRGNIAKFSLPLE
ncbi:RodZ domain-containing protein [Thalassotalea piscium]|uniref:Cytoskeleton protein RodZ n=1 Tax=Thalassotalea piscium TaxID=1230533 RepID=A0A7X0NFZ6_9GAMM|nr:RodZ domain-containing protein [Thalassotalea piscium]MBB6542719.1 cytoskeleton protein RodZ [Thalassotalea piscium]